MGSESARLAAMLAHGVRSLAYIDLCRLSAVLQASSVVGSTQAQDLLAEAEELRAAGESKRLKAGY